MQSKTKYLKLLIWKMFGRDYFLLSFPNHTISVHVKSPTEFTQVFALQTLQQWAASHLLQVLSSRLCTEELTQQPNIGFILSYILL